MEMRPYSPDLGALLAETIAGLGIPCSKRSVFGHETWFLNGYMFAGANVDGIWVNLGEAAVQAELKTTPGVSEFSPVRDMVMTNYLLLGQTIHADHTLLKQWLMRSAEYLQSRPPRPQKERSPKKE